MTDPSFLLQSSAAKDLMELARDLQAMVDNRRAALEQPLTDRDIDFDVSLDLAEPAEHAGAV
jgi:hypothetical protein